MAAGRATDPLVTLVMPVWRPRRDWLVDAVASALGQRGCRVEVVVVDDGSPEPVARMLAGVGDGRLRTVRVGHGGISHARNAGVDAAAGDFLRFVDGDDVLPPDSTADLLALTEGRDDVVAYGATVVCDADLHPRGRRASRVRGRAVRACILGRFDVTVPAMLFPRGVVDAAGRFDRTLEPCEDWDFVLRALEHARVRGHRRPALHYRRHAASLTHTATNGWEATLAVVARWRDRHPEVAGTRLAARIDAMLDLRRARRETGGRPWRSARFWSVCGRDPRAALGALRVACTAPIAGLIHRWPRGPIAATSA